MIEAPATAAAAARDYAPLVLRIAHAVRRKLPYSVDIKDLNQQGMIGLLQAVGSFDARQHVDFATYASHRVRGAMLDGLRDADWVSRSARSLFREIDGARHRAEQRKLGAVGAAEIAEEMSISVGQFQERRYEAAPMIMLYLEDIPSMLGPHEEEENDPLERLLPKVFSSPPDEIELQQRRRDYDQALEGLSQRQRRLMFLYYEEGMRFREIGLEFGVSEARVCQMHAVIVKLLRAALQGWGALDPAYKIPAEGTARSARAARWQAARAEEARSRVGETATA